MPHNKTTRPLTASERIRLARRIDRARREQIRVDHIVARRSFQSTDQLMRDNRAGGF